MRKSKMLATHMTYEKQCAFCKVASGLLFTGLGAFNAWRVSQIWSHLRAQERLFQFSATAFIYGLAGVSFF